jgi:SAM-dependent methyltransferase
MKTDYDEIVRPLVAASDSQKVARFNSLLTGWVEKNWDVIDLGCGVGVTTARLKELGSNPVGVDSFKSAIAYATNKYKNIDFVHAKDEFEYLAELQYFVDCVCIRALTTDTDTQQLNNLITASIGVLRPHGTLILNLNDEPSIDALLGAFPGLYLAYKTAYRTDTRNTFYFTVLKKTGVPA